MDMGLGFLFTLQLSSGNKPSTGASLIICDTALIESSIENVIKATNSFFICLIF